MRGCAADPGVVRLLCERRWSPQPRHLHPLSQLLSLACRLSVIIAFNHLAAEGREVNLEMPMAIAIPTARNT